MKYLLTESQTNKENKQKPTEWLFIACDVSMRKDFLLPN